MKQFLDILPLLVFFLFYRILDIYWATAALIAATFFTLVFAWIKYKKVETMTLVTFGTVAVFGGLTLIFHNDMFIKWKVTVVFFFFAVVLISGQFILNKPIIQRLFSKKIDLPDRIWMALNLYWALFFFICSLANIYVAFWLAENTWVVFKSFILPSATLVASVVSGIYVYKHLPDEKKKQNF